MLLELYRTFGINLDLALEAQEIVRGETGREIPGVIVNRESRPHASVTTVSIVDQAAEKTMGKPPGNYITIEAPVIRENNRPAQQQVAAILAEKLASLLHLSGEAAVLLIGLGNWHATPDALGPRVIDYSMVTRHLFQYAPQELKEGMRPVSALAPGVLGITGIETAEIIKGVIEKTRPDLVIAIDSLAARNVGRIATTIQIADTGISPGSGTGNQRTGINQESMGVPVIAIGVPTVVHAAVIAQDTIDRFREQLKTLSHLKHQDYDNLSPEFIRPAIEEVLQPFAGNLMVTPKEIDTLIMHTARIIAGGISMALHPSIKLEDYNNYLN